MIDAVVYINLAHRKDRKAHILSELDKIKGVSPTIHRLEAVLEPLCGHLGCGKSHVQALELAIQHKWNSVLIVEDDLLFTESPDSLCSKLTAVFDVSWDTVLLGLGHHNISPSSYPNLYKVISTSCTHGYLVRSHYYEILLENFKTAVAKMTRELETHKNECVKNNQPITKLNHCSAIDQEWCRLQARDTYYVFMPELGKQKNELYSDNNCSMEHQKSKIAATSSI